MKKQPDPIEWCVECIDYVHEKGGYCLRTAAYIKDVDARIGIDPRCPLKNYNKPEPRFKFEFKNNPPTGVPDGAVVMIGNHVRFFMSDGSEYEKEAA